MTPAEFISRWQDSAGAELANSQSFLKELCDLLDVPQPEPTRADETLNTYTFEKAVTFNNGDGTTSTGRVDLYRRSAFVLESKQGSERKAAEQAAALAEITRSRRQRTGTAARGTAAWDQAMAKARAQAERYAKALPDWPPLLIVVDVGHCFDLYADFSQSGKNYVHFPDPQNYRIPLAALADDAVRALLRSAWRDPQSLDPSRRTARVTRELAAKLAELAKRLEARTDKHGQKLYSPDAVAQFLMRCLFTMFAEDVPLFEATQQQADREKKFTHLLESLRDNPGDFVPMVEGLWQKMNTGGFSESFRMRVRQFNGGLFEDNTALPLNRDELELLIEAAHAQWRDVEPAIFGTLLERALDAHERHKLGAHFTPRAYVERLVMPTIIEPLREEWTDAYATAAQLQAVGKRQEAIKTIRDFHAKLCETRVLDPACGSGNFLYVALELMKRLEGEVLNTLLQFGEAQRELPSLTIDPHQFLGIEVNPRAAAITDLVLWIGYLQWHFRTRGSEPPSEPIIRKFKNIECRDAVLTWDAVEPVVDEAGNPVTRWDGRTTKRHPVTGEEVPDETARVHELRYLNPRKAEWPKVDYIVGNPPFIGNKRMRFHLGDGYSTTIRATWDDVPETVDYVMYWWQKAAIAIHKKDVKRFGFISTNSLRQTFNRCVLEKHLSDQSRLSLAFAIPDHPWVDSADGAAVRISMTVAVAGEQFGRLQNVVSEEHRGDFGVDVTLRERIGQIRQDLTIGADVAATLALTSNKGLSNRGVSFVGSGFVVSREEATSLGLGKAPNLDNHIRPMLNGRDITAESRDAFAIDLLGLSIDDVRNSYPEVFQWVYERVKPERDVSQRPIYREKWWIFGEPRASFRPALKGLPRYIATTMTAKHRFFVFVDELTLADQGLIVIASQDASVLGTLSSRTHVVWALAAGGRLGIGNDPRYNNTRCFEMFPFPVASTSSKQRIRELGEQLDAHRKRQQSLHPELTMTGMYNVLEKLRAGEELTAKDRVIHEQGLVAVLRQIHDDLDAAVADAYDWPHDLTDEKILERLVALNHERAAEEQRGLVRWLRPEFQCPGGAPASQPELELEEEVKVAAKPKAAAAKQAFPKSLPDRMRAIRSALAQFAAPATPDDIAKLFKGARKDTIVELLDTLVDVGQARRTDDGRIVL